MLLSGESLTLTLNLAHDLLPVMWSALLLWISLDLCSKDNKCLQTRFLNGLACAAVAVLHTAQVVFDDPSGLSVIVLLAVLTVFMLLQYIRKWYLEACFLLLAVTTVLIQYLGLMLELLMGTGWWGLAAAGIAAIIGSALMEKFITQRVQVVDFQS